MPQPPLAMSTPERRELLELARAVLGGGGVDHDRHPERADLPEEQFVGKLGTVEPDPQIGGMGGVLGRLGHPDSDGRDRLRAEGESAVQHDHAHRRDYRGAAPRWRAEGDHAALAVDQMFGMRELFDVVGGVRDEQPLCGFDERLAFGARARDVAQDRGELGFVARVAVDPGAGHHLGVVLAMAGDRLEGDDRKTDGERLHAGEPTGVLDQRVGRRHERRHLVGPADHGAEPARLELGPEVVVATADGDRVELPGAPDRLDRRHDVADPPGAGHDEHGAVFGSEPEFAAHRLAVVVGLAEPLADERPAGAARPSRRVTRRPRRRSHSPRGDGRHRGAPRASGRRNR